MNNKNYIKVEGHSSLVRDQTTKAILNLNMTDYENYILTKRIKEDEERRVDNIETEMNIIRNDLEEIKNLLRNLSNGSR
jgi:K+/H+ antiporter YhaU regulatory subunit KhtT